MADDMISVELVCLWMSDTEGVCSIVTAKFLNEWIAKNL